jgi:hypothetical protein
MAGSGSTSVPERPLDMLQLAITPLDGFAPLVGILSLVSLFVRSAPKSATVCGGEGDRFDPLPLLGPPRGTAVQRS